MPPKSSFYSCRLLLVVVGLCTPVLSKSGPRPRITTTSLPGGTVGLAYSQILSAVSGAPPYNWSLRSGSLPPGIEISSTGIISGLPSSAGSWAFSVQIYDSMGRNNFRNLTLSIAQPSASPLQITTASLPAGTAGTTYRATLQGIGGISPYTWSVISGQLAGGLGLSSGGIISGTPIASGTYSATIQMADSSGLTASAVFSLAVAVCTSCSSNLAITTTSLPAGALNTAYNAKLAASGGMTPYTWSASSGQLPPGLALATSGAISGTPSTAGSYNVGLTVADSAGQSVSQVYQVTISTTSSLDQYGGRTDIACSGGAKPHFYTEKIGSRWWLCTPDGHAFFDTEADVVSAADQDTAPQGTSYHNVVVSKYGTANNYAAWAAAQKSRLTAWGFNTVGQYSDWYAWGSVEPGPAMPYSVMLNLMRQALPNKGGYASDGLKELQSAIDPKYYNGYFGTIADIFDPKWITYYDNALTADVMGINSAKNDPYLMYLVSDDRDAFFGWGPGNQYGYGVPSFHLGWVTLIASAKMWYSAGRYPTTNNLFKDPIVYSKLGLRDYLKSLTQYQTSGIADISKLNAAWGSNYTTWDSSADTYNDTICSGQWNGTQQSCTVTLSHGNIGKQSVGVSVNGTIWAGDHINYNDDTTGYFGGANGASGSINYASGAITINFTAPLPSGAAVTVQYDSNGFGFGSGLLDEDGRHSWVCSDWVALNNCNTNIQTDLNNFLYVFAKQYTSNVASIIHAHYPGILNACMGTLSNPDGGKTRDQFIQATAEQCDIVNVSVGAPTITVDAAYAQQMLDDTYTAMGSSKKPMLPQREIVANADSSFSGWPCVAGSYDCATSQSQKGQTYYNWMNWMLSARDTTTGDYPIVGYEYWQYVDNVGEKNDFGLISNLDNAYDGVEATTGLHPCSAPLNGGVSGVAAYTCGSVTVNGTTYSEPGNFGDAISGVKAGNALWRSVQ